MKPWHYFSIFSFQNALLFILSSKSHTAQHNKTICIKLSETSPSTFIRATLHVFPVCSMNLFSLTILSLSARCSEEKENNFYSSDSDFDDEEPKKFHIQIRPVASSNRSNSAATEKELKATVGALTLPPNRGVRQQVVLVFGFSCHVLYVFQDFDLEYLPPILCPQDWEWISDLKSKPVLNRPKGEKK